MRKITLDFNGMSTPEQVHAYIAQAMELPGHYGKNLDALHDCLTDISSPTCVGIYNMDISNSYMETLAEVFRDAESDNPKLSVFFGQKWLND